MYGERIKDLRAARNMTQAQLAKAIGMEGKESTLRMWELEKSLPSIDKIIILADYFYVTVDYLLGRKTEEERVSITAVEEHFKEVELRLKYMEILETLKNYSLWLYSYAPSETPKMLSFIHDFIRALDELPIIPDSCTSDDSMSISANSEIILKNNKITDKRVYRRIVFGQAWQSFDEKICRVINEIRAHSSKHLIDVMCDIEDTLEG